MTTYLALSLGIIGTFGLRAAMILSDGRFGSSRWLQARISLVSATVLAALVASAMFVSDGVASAPHPVTLASVAGGAFAAHRTSKMSAALAVGLPIYWIGALAGFV